MPMQIERWHNELFRSAKNGDSNSLGLLLKHYQAALYSSALRLMGFGDAARDAVQETFIIALTHIHQVRDGASFGAWLHRVLTNHCLMVKRKETQEIFLSKFAGFNLDDLIYEDTSRAWEEVRNEQRVRAALTQLPEPLRLVTILRYYSRFKSYEEIAAITQIPIGTVRSRLSAARKQLMNLFNHHDIELHPLIRDAENRANHFREIFDNVYDNANLREKYIQMHEEKMVVVANSGKIIRNGRQYWKRMIYDDLKYGSRMKPDIIFCSGNLTIIEGPNENSPEYPNHCPPNAAIVYHHNKNSIYMMRIYDPR
jgi:RNA polymerase sigma factor (sigma-70 family)